jgi:beta-lactamase regulating signal transducer with metallopeptidase domain
VRPLVLAAAAWLLLRLFRVRHPASQHAVWIGVAVGMLLLPLLSALAPHWKVPLLPAKQVAAVKLPTRVSPAVTLLRATVATPTTARKTPVFNILLWLYWAGLIARVAYRAIGWAMLRRLVAGSRAVHGRVRESADVIAPVTAGAVHPVVILPAGWRGWDSMTRRAVLAHEFAHIRRVDGLAALLARCITCVYWYHPIAWLVARRISETAESACDAAALEGLRDPASYSRILLAFAEKVNATGYRVGLPGLAMAAPSGIGKRIDRVFELSGRDMRRLRRPGAVVTVLGAPLLCLAATAGLGERIRISPPQPWPPSAPAFSQKKVSSYIAHAQAPSPRETALPSLTDTLAGQIPPPPGLYLDQDLEEYHRRQAYGDDHFSYSRVHGSNTARGQAYVHFGLADSIEDHSATADTPAYQLWRYRHVDDAANNLMLEFVDAAGSGEYREAIGPGMPSAYAIAGEFGVTTVHILLSPGVGRLHLSATISSTARDAAVIAFEEESAGEPVSKTTTLAPGKYTLTVDLNDEATGIASRGEQSFQVR